MNSSIHNNLLENVSNVAIFGISGAIGNAYLQLFISNKNIQKITTFSRSKLQTAHSKVSHFTIDIFDETNLKQTLDNIQETFQLIIVCTGILHTATTMPEKSLNQTNLKAYETFYKVNTIGPALIAKHCLNKLDKTKTSVFAALSARVGSIEDNKLGGWYAYRMSKTALNMFIKTASIEIKRQNPNAIVVGLHPGTVDSPLSKPFQKNIKPEKLFTPEFSANKLIHVIHSLNINDSGKIFAWDGKQIPY